MKKLLTTILLFSLAVTLVAKEIDITKSRGTDQESIVSLNPEPESTIYDPSQIIEITFNKALHSKRRGKNSISLMFLGCNEDDNNKQKREHTRLRQQCEQKFIHHKKLKNMCRKCSDKSKKHRKYRACKPHHVRGKVSMSDDKTLQFTASKPLAYGYYEVHIQGVRTIERKRVSPISYRFKIEKNSVETLNINQEDISIKEGTTIPLTLTATYKDGSTQSIDENLTWSIADESIATIDNTTLQATKEGETLIQASYENVSSQMIPVTVYIEINGYRLPPEPDESVNNSTLLGIDFNDNGVRDDVERFIINRYKDHHKIVTEIGFQGARAYQEILDNPLNSELHIKLQDAQECNFYFQDDAEEFGDPILIDEYMLDKYEWLELNTKERKEAFLEHDKTLSGGVYRLTPAPESKDKCNFDVDALLGGQ